MNIRKRVGDGLRAALMIGCSLVINGTMIETVQAHGVYSVVCTDSAGNVKWIDTAPNLVTTVGKNLQLDSSLAGSAYTTVGPFMGLISSVSYTAISAGDTMTSHAGWLEAGATNLPTYTAPRKTCVWAAASGGSKALSAPLAFTITGAGTIKGAFLCTGTGALSTIDNTAGTLFSAGLFTGGDRLVAIADIVNVSYSESL